MPILFWPYGSAVAELFAVANLDFEYELAGRNGLPASVARRWRHVLRLLPEARRATCLDPVNLTGPVQGELLPWGVTPRVVQMAPHQDFPDPAVVRRVNDKQFSHELEKRFGVELPCARLVTSLEELEAAVADCPHDWVLKHPMGVSARERAVGKQGRISDSGRGWARKQFVNWTLLFEPWVDPRRDFSMHFEIARDGSVEFVGHCQLVADPGGVYRGNQLVPGQELAGRALACGREVAGELARLGYWGPVGIDAFEGVLGEHPVLRPLVEINARYSFGRLTLALRDWIPENWCLLWSHPKIAPTAHPPLPQGAGPGAYGLPVEVDPDGSVGTLLIIAPNVEELNRIASLTQ